MTDVRRLFDAMNRRDVGAIHQALSAHPFPPQERGAAQCVGCAHPAHAALGCVMVPLFTREGRCGCWYDR